MKFLLIFSFLLIQNVGSFAANESSSTEGNSKKNQLEELFIWKLSDELKLAPAVEKQFADLIREVNQKKFSGSQKIEEMTRVFIQSKDIAAREKNFKNLRKAYADYNQISLYELDQLKKIIGLESVSTYLQVKQELTSKVKTLLIQGERKENEESAPSATAAKKTPFPTPKVIVVPSKKQVAPANGTEEK